MFQNVQIGFKYWQNVSFWSQTIDFGHIYLASHFKFKNLLRVTHNSEFVAFELETREIWPYSIVWDQNENFYQNLGPIWKFWNIKNQNKY